MNWPLILAATVVTIFIIALVIALGLFWPSVSKMRWDYRGSSVRQRAEAPRIALVMSLFLTLPELLSYLWDHFKMTAENLGALVTGAGFLLTSPLSFPLIALYQSHDCRKKVANDERRRALQDADV